MITLNRSSASVELELNRLKVAARTEVNKSVEEVRKLFITPIVGQELIYAEKESEAKRFMLLDPEPEDLTEFPFIAGEIGSSAPTAYEVAQLFLNLGAYWRHVGSQLEHLRISANTQIDAATSKETIDGIVSTLSQLLEAFK